MEHSVRRTERCSNDGTRRIHLDVSSCLTNKKAPVGQEGITMIIKYIGWFVFTPLTVLFVLLNEKLYDRHVNETLRLMLYLAWIVLLILLMLLLIWILKL